MKLADATKIYFLMEQLAAEVGYPGSGQSTPNQVETIPTYAPPSLKKRRRPPTDEEIDEAEQKIMPDKAKERKLYKAQRIGKSTGLQVW